jgi:hypothetical protein
MQQRVKLHAGVETARCLQAVFWASRAAAFPVACDVQHAIMVLDAATHGVGV